MGQIVDLLWKRHATRAISPEPLPEAVIDDLAEAARLAPSCFNKQPWRYLFLTSEGARAKGSQALSEGNRPWASRAPLLVVAHTRPGDDCQLPGRVYHQFDLGLSVMNLMLAASEHDLVARPMAGFDPERARELFDLPAEAQALVMLAVGHPSEDEDHLAEHYQGLANKPRERRDVSEIVERL